MKPSFLEHWLAGLAGRRLDDTTLGEGLTVRVRLWAELFPHLPADATGAWLVYKLGDEVQTVPVSGPVTVGRGAEATLRIDCPWLSRVHFKLLPDATGWEIEDAGGKNPLHLNGHPVPRSPLKSGDAIRVGDLDLLFVVVRS